MRDDAPLNLGHLYEFPLTESMESLLRDWKIREIHFKLLVELFIILIRVLCLFEFVVVEILSCWWG